MPEPIPKPPPSGADRVSVRVARLADRQWGVVTRRQLEERGLGRRAIQGWVGKGILRPIYPGVFSVGHLVLTTRARLAAALLYAGPGAALSQLTAAAWWGVVPSHPNAIHVSAVRRVRDRPGLVIHHPRDLHPVRHNGLPVTSVARTLRDIAAHLPFDELRRVIAEAEYRRLVDLEAVYRILGRGRPGAAKLRRALDAHLPELGRTISPLEDRFLLLCERFGIPLPEPNARLLGYRVDALWRRERVAVELDGGDAHATRAAMERDRSRDLKLRAAGFVVLRYTWRQVTSEPGAVAADLHAALTAPWATSKSRAASL
jgi:hypothetical protein